MKINVKSIANLAYNWITFTAHTQHSIYMLKKIGFFLFDGLDNTTLASTKVLQILTI